MRLLREDQKWADAPELGSAAMVADQDTGAGFELCHLRRCRVGHASKRAVEGGPSGQGSWSVIIFAALSGNAEQRAKPPPGRLSDGR